MNDTVEGTVEAKTPAVRPEIIRGRMPIAVVALARFGNTKNDSVAEQAKQFGTTVGKIDDIRKNRNFAYVTEAFKPTAAQVDEGVEYLKKHHAYDAANTDALVNELAKTPVATEAEAAAFEEARSAARGQRATTKEGEPAEAGGGNRRKGKGKTAEIQGGAVTAEALV